MSESTGPRVGFRMVFDTVAGLAAIVGCTVLVWKLVLASPKSPSGLSSGLQCPPNRFRWPAPR